MSALKINIILFGIGKVGSALIQQIEESQLFFQEKYGVELRFPIITNSTLAFFEKKGHTNSWEANFNQLAIPFKIEDIVAYAKQQDFENLIAVDATTGTELSKSYIELIQNGFNIVAANKSANILHQDFYNEIRRNLKKFDKIFLYETTISTGLPLLSTLKELQASGEKITKIRGVFSDALSYIFNRFGNEEVPFATLLEEAETNGYTEKDSRIDLSGTEVAEKLVIIARELGLNTDVNAVGITSLLVPALDKSISKTEYHNRKNLLNTPFKVAKLTQTENHVLRYVGEINIENNKLSAQLISVPSNSNLGQLKNRDKLIEIYTETNGANPYVIQSVSTDTIGVARTVIKDIIRISNQIKRKELV
ncbi:aspartate kinase [Flavobacterium sp.]|uniref:aspartate kinase n=1 Tax=Flavobacterium sp. TaxID=239 RepID=UPI0026318FB7|nr:aspartate kinase [Flavobacterium sp.]